MPRLRALRGPLDGRGDLDHPGAGLDGGCAGHVFTGDPTRPVAGRTTATSCRRSRRRHPEPDAHAETTPTATPTPTPNRPPPPRHPRRRRHRRRHPHRRRRRRPTAPPRRLRSRPRRAAPSPGHPCRWWSRPTDNVGVSSVAIWSGTTKLGNATRQADGTWRATFDSLVLPERRLRGPGQGHRSQRQCRHERPGHGDRAQLIGVPGVQRRAQLSLRPCNERKRA